MDQSESRPAIEAENLTREFGTLRAVDGLSFEVPRGIVFGFLGPNGSGKTNRKPKTPRSSPELAWSAVSHQGKRS